MKQAGATILFSLFTLLFSPRIFAASYYLAPYGNDSNLGSESSPLKTFAKAFTLMKAGDVLVVEDGVYEQIVEKFPTGESWEKNITIKAEHSRKAIIRPLTGATAVGIRYADGRTPKRYIVFEGFVVDCINMTDTCMHIAGQDDTTTDTDHIRVINNEIMHTSNNAVFAPHGPYAAYEAYGSGILNARADYVEYLNNDIHDNGKTDFDHGIYYYGIGSVIDGNRIYNNRGSGIKLGWSSLTKDNIVRNNTIYNNNLAWTINPDYGVKRQGRGISTHRSDNSQIYNNIVSGAHTAGIDVIYDVTHAKVYNNTVSVMGNNYTANGISIGGGAGTDAAPDVTDTIVKNNLVYQGSSNASSITNAAIFHGTRASGTVIENNLTYGSNPNIEFKDSVAASFKNNIVNQNPVFYNLKEKNFHLTENSLARNGGQSIHEIATDIRGIPRQGDAFDIGAYEYTVPGDATGDEKVTGADYVIWLNEYLLTGERRGDFNLDGIVNGADYIMFLTRYGS